MQSETPPILNIAAARGIHVAPRRKTVPETSEVVRPETRPENDPAIWPRITLVTPVYNGIRFIEDTIRSIVYQGYPNLEYIVVDGGSTDGTVDIIRKYQKHISWWVSRKDRGVYDALNTGFAQATGEIMGWLNASDLLHTSGLFVVGSVFASLPAVEWLTGRPTRFNPNGMTVDIRALPSWSRYRFLAGANKYIQQESTFWRKSLWEKAGSELNASYRDVGDFDLWVRFFRHARLYSVDALIGGYRFHSDSISATDMDRYNQRCDKIIESELKSTPRAGAVKMFRRVSRAVKDIPKVRGLWKRVALNGLYNWAGPDWPPIVEDQENKWVIREGMHRMRGLTR
ncbi:MAG: glycosyltransferase family 2 protein [Candidatus Acidiferrum sp.]